MTDYYKVNDYTLNMLDVLQQSAKINTSLRHIFNFASGTVTTIYRQEASSALTSSMQIQRFSELDSTAEIELMYAKLKELGGSPPPLSETLTGKLAKGVVPKLPQN